MLLVTFHSGHHVGAYEDDGRLRTLKVLHGAPGEVSELRALKLVSTGVLWVASGSMSTSRVVAFTGSGDSYQYKNTVAEFTSINSLYHPFDFTFDNAGFSYVSNQDSDVVARLKVASDFFSAAPTDFAPALPRDGEFLSSTFVASTNGQLPNLPPTCAVAPPAGLEVSFDNTGKVVKSVRGVLCVNGVLYVADEVAASVKVYDSDGHYQGGASCVPGPVHLQLFEQPARQTLLVSNGTEVLSGLIDPSEPSNLKLEPIQGIDVKSVSGLAVAPGSILFAGSRVEDDPLVYKYTGFPDDPVLATTFKVDAAPEFLMYIEEPA
jgi:hypothetical protein